MAEKPQKRGDPGTLIMIGGIVSIAGAYLYGGWMAAMTVAGIEIFLAGLTAAITNRLSDVAAQEPGAQA